VFPQVLGFVALKAFVGAGVYRETVVVGTCMAFICIMPPEFSGEVSVMSDEYGLIVPTG
jgi:hypothetical protein